MRKFDLHIFEENLLAEPADLFREDDKVFKSRSIGTGYIKLDLKTVVSRLYDVGIIVNDGIVKFAGANSQNYSITPQLSDLDIYRTNFVAIERKGRLMSWVLYYVRCYSFFPSLMARSFSYICLFD